MLITFGLKDSDNVADYHQSWWDWWISSNSPVKVDKLTKESLIRRWAFGDKVEASNENDDIVKLEEVKEELEKVDVWSERNT